MLVAIPENIISSWQLASWGLNPTQRGPPNQEIRPSINHWFPLRRPAFFGAGYFLGGKRGFRAGRDPYGLAAHFGIKRPLERLGLL